ncbi:ANTAR domain-containing protein [Brachybacterium sp. UNK5269]|uniref:ANTAR domain-containing protein n=1 Tax=Brachybacterium sp. UNK5269 TaxID=3408576 RepID=UPI003BB13E5E
MRPHDFAEEPGRQVRARMMALFTEAVVPRTDALPGDGEQGEARFLRMCRALVQVTEAQGGALTLAPGELHRVTLCATDDTASRLENLQEVIGQGPVLDAASSGRVITAELGGQPGTGPWPVLASTMAEELGALVVQALPMRVGSETLGVASVYRRAATGRWSPPTHEASVLAGMIGAAIVSSGLDGEAGLSWDVRDRISQATGMVIAQLGISAVDAAALIRTAAFSAGMDMAEIATEILEYRRDFSTDQDGGGDHR